jgi:hypothetical protein
MPFKNKEDSQRNKREYYIKNKEKIAEKDKKYREKNKEKISAYHKDYYQKNKTRKAINSRKRYERCKEKMNGQAKAYRETHKEELREYQKNYYYLKKETDPTFMLRKNISSTVRNHLKKSGGSKNSNSCIDRLPFTISELKMHLESQFESWMNWDNWGKYDPKVWNDQDPLTWRWQIDHIIPQSTLPFTSLDDENFITCWSLTNLRPLNAKQNYMDGVSKARH